MTLEAFYITFLTRLAVALPKNIPTPVETSNLITSFTTLLENSQLLSTKSPAKQIQTTLGRARHACHTETIIGSQQTATLTPVSLLCRR